MDSKKYNKHLSKYLKGVPLDHKKIFNSFVQTYGHYKKQGLSIDGLIDTGEETVIQIRCPESFDSSLIPKIYKGLKIRR